MTAYVRDIATNEITHGTTPTTFSPYNSISHAQVITMIVRGPDTLQPAGHGRVGFLSLSFEWRRAATDD